MNAKKTIFIVLLGIFAANFSFGQEKDGVFSTQIDPIKSVQVFPNPATEFVTIRFDNPIANQLKFAIHNIIGNEIEVVTEIMDEFEVRIKVKDIHEGYYFLSIQNMQSGMKSTHKFLKR
jgi:hypothetical protein